MSVLVFAETWEGSFKKATYEAVSYAARVAAMMNTEAIAVVLGAVADDPATLGKYGAAKVLTGGADLPGFTAGGYADLLVQAAEAHQASIIVVSGTFNGKSLQGQLSVQFNASALTNAVALPSSVNPLRVKRSAFSSKGFVEYQAQLNRAVISIVPNGIGVAEVPAAGAVAPLQAQVAAGAVKTTSTGVDRVKGQIPLPEAELVVSAGRGMKAPENWTMVEELADVLGAATACSKPVSDMHWRPHSEHVGQTGIAIRPNLYIAIGISGAIQHLAGVSNSKTIVVINSDPEAPFFKAADYGVVGDAFQVVPKLTEAIKKLKAHA
jgi:electron transfer flavoprotein alpha subunit